MSLLSWERGLKSYEPLVSLSQVVVAPLVGAWIEIDYLKTGVKADGVAPLVGAWIEILLLR